MPNWCQNNITISGPKAEVKALWDKAQTAAQHEDFKTKEVTMGFGLLSAMRPEPDYTKVEVHKTYYFDENEPRPQLSDTPWWDWRVQNWGTKWDITDDGLEYLENDDGTAEITGWFDSAWSPPIECYDYFTEKHPEFSIYADYYEPGCDFVGRYTPEDHLYIDSITDLINLGEKNWTPNQKELLDDFGILEEEWRFEEEEESNE